jgi:hypothetical protein
MKKKIMVLNFLSFYNFNTSLNCFNIHEAIILIGLQVNCSFSNGPQIQNTIDLCYARQPLAL